VNALLHDKAGGNAVGVPMDVPSAVARAAECLDDARWWSVPDALQSAAWAAVPGAGPADVDPWKRLLEVSEQGAAGGVRLAYAIASRVAGNSGRDDVVIAAVTGQARSMREVEPPEDWALFDAYAALVSLHELDVYWTRQRGYRATSIEDLPGAPAETGPDPLGADPFANEQETPK
jgi:hypothetical protein